MARTLQPEQHRQRRERIVQAAWHCFAQYGIAGTRTAHLCQQAGMSPGHLFHYFPNKSAIIAAALEHEATAAQDAEETDASAWDALQHWLRSQWHQLHDPVVARLTLEILASSTHNPVVAAAVQAHESARHQRVCHWLEQAARDGDVRLHAAPSQAAQWLLLLLDGAAGRVMAHAPWNRPDELAVLQQALGQLLQPPPTLA